MFSAADQTSPNYLLHFYPNLTFILISITPADSTVDGTWWAPDSLSAPEPS